MSHFSTFLCLYLMFILSIKFIQITFIYLLTMCKPNSNWNKKKLIHIQWCQLLEIFSSIDKKVNLKRHFKSIREPAVHEKNALSDLKAKVLTQYFILNGKILHNWVFYRRIIKDSFIKLISTPACHLKAL